MLMLRDTRYIPAAPTAANLMHGNISGMMRTGLNNDTLSILSTISSSLQSSVTKLLTTLNNVDRISVFTLVSINPAQVGIFCRAASVQSVQKYSYTGCIKKVNSWKILPMQRALDVLIQYCNSE